jgi:hypothetical protein
MAKDLTEAIAALTEAASGKTSRVDRSLPDPRIPPAIPARTGSSKPIAGAAAGGGIASPLTETDYADRTWHAERTITSTDGVWALKINPLKSIKFKDALDADVVFDLKDRP